MGKAIKSIGRGVGSALGAVSGFLPPGLSHIARAGGSVLGGGNMQSHLGSLGFGGGGGMGDWAKIAGLAGAGILGADALRGNNPFQGSVNQIGGGSAGATGDMFNQFLQQQMGGGGMSTAINNMLQGRPGDPASLQQYFGAGMDGNGMAQNLPDQMQGFGTSADLERIINPEANVAAAQQLFDRQSQMDVANMRQRFGNRAMGSGAQFAESQYLADANPRFAMAMDEITRANQAQQLQQRDQDLRNFLGSRGLDVSQLGQAGQMGLQNQQLGNQWNLGLQGIGADRERTQLSAQQSALQQLFGGMNNAMGIGTPQAQMMQNPSLFSQLFNPMMAAGGLWSQMQQAKAMGQSGNGASAPQGMNMPTPSIDWGQLGQPGFGGGMFGGQSIGQFPSPAGTPTGFGQFGGINPVLYGGGTP